MKKYLFLLLTIFFMFGRIIQAGETAELISTININKLEMLEMLEADDLIIKDLEFSPDNEQLAFVQADPLSFDGVVTIWEIRTQEAHPLGMTGGENIQATTLTYSTDGALLILGNADGEVTVFDVSVGQVQMIQKVDTGNINSVAVDPDSTLIAVTSTCWGGCGGEQSFTLFNRVDNNILVSLPNDKTPYYGGGVSTTFSPDGSLLAFSITGRGLVRLWDARTLTQIATLESHAPWIFDMMFTPDGRTLIYLGTDGIRVWDIETTLATNGQQNEFRLFARRKQNKTIYSLALNPDGTILAAGNLDGTIDLWEVATGNLLHTLEGHQYYVRPGMRDGRVLSLDFSPDGTLLASGGIDGTVRVWGIPSDG